jgi:hypothetical protein
MSEQHAAALRIVIKPTLNGRKWIARLGDQILCVSVSPFVMSARALITAGYPADSVIEMWRPNTDERAFRGRLGVVAATRLEGERAEASQKAPRRARNESPVRDLDSRATELPPLRRACPGPVSRERPRQ